METSSTFPSNARRLARLGRQRFIEGLSAELPALDAELQEFTTHLMGLTATQRVMQERRDLWVRYQQFHGAWIAGAARALRDAVATLPSTRSAALSGDFSLAGLELVSDDVVENKILASRIGLSVAEQAGPAFDAVRRHLQHLEGEEPGERDLLRPEVLALQLVAPWVACGLLRTDLQALLEPLQRTLGAMVLAQYEALVRFFEEQGVRPDDDLRSRVRRTGGATVQGGLAPVSVMGAGMGVQQAAADPTGVGLRAPSRPMGALQGGASGFAGTQAAAYGSPLVRARQRAQGVMGQLHRILVQPAIAAFSPSGAGRMGGAAGDVAAPAAPATAALQQALAEQRLMADSFYRSEIATLVLDYHSPAAVVQVAGAARERTAELKAKAETPGEKAIIEVVALMFQSILSEDRIPPAVRVWFARLQVPVLRVALSEPEFFSDMAHPARQLIDRMGGVVLGFDTAAIQGSALEAEIRRVVQVIEQYPETGQRVFQLVLAEFEAFISRYLTAPQATSRIVSVAQQVEQKETMAIQYTIELRNLLKDMPVRDEIRSFLFKTWAEVLALSAVRSGAQHADTAAFKRAATDLVWAASAKPQRAERAKVIQSLPGLLQRLRQGLELLGVTGAPQDVHIKILTDTLADAFLSKTASIPQAHIDAMARRLDHLEDYMSDATLGDMPLDADYLEMMLGIDASSIHVAADNGTPVDEAMVAWARELQLGAWFTLDHNGASAQVQYAWHSERRQLHLFAAPDGSSYLLQLRRMAAYLQAGLLVPQEEEALTMRATRDALAKIDANPERLLG
ncbi:DUF1631 family protein [Paracidovorax citrulli]|uniref:DUF1631 family protein n=2 Tax=Paracidovorax citrulli TaxID=80869 RepID=A1TW39_PARC0|nr:DUF1631 family protein [Paracidovorax citrulli]ABM35177.1 conserved hypothetical protein [Paracidovorax citrulli AAC00-1]ATG96310.1 DUF1631 domain-containing protein [Paracidovorax citrulli]PVY64631.1 uncharacterized protein DUF1631 [Paracidovorax citrulli]REG71170.1 uncharacterized protein DUF1631 [Paracidovorax citrulli]RLJ95723.1 uncharacterized protein DUF1631 [Paracidovorax citrulli]